MTITGSHYARLLRIATYASVATACILIGGKSIAWLQTGSVSVLASLIDSLMDAAASLINLFAVRYSLMPADEEHRFGHGKAESLAGLAQATFIAGSAVFLLMHAADRLINPQPLQDVATGIGVMVFAMAATLVLLGIQRYTIVKTGSTAIRADSLHYTTDLLTNGATIVALGLSTFGWLTLDPILAIAIAGFILYSAWQIGHEAFQLLMDRELPPEDLERIREIAEAHKEVLGMHDLRTRRSGQTAIIQMHIELDGALSLRSAHRITDEVEAELHAAFPRAEVLIHQDPVSPDNGDRRNR